MNYIYDINWKRKSKQYYKVFIYYKTPQNRKQYLKVNYPVTQEIEPNSKLGQILKIKNPVKLSLYYIKKILNKSNYEL